MRFDSATLRRWAIRAPFALGGFVLVTLGGQFLVALAEERGLFTRPASKVKAAVAFLMSIISHPAFFVLAGLVVGFAVGVWLDALVRRRERAPLVEQAKADLPDLVARAERAAAGIFALAAELNVPPTHPKYTRLDAHGGDAWQEDNHHRMERARDEYAKNYAVEVWQILETSKKYLEIRPHDFSAITHPVAGFSFDEAAGVLARIAARLRQIEPAAS